MAILDKIFGKSKKINDLGKKLIEAKGELHAKERRLYEATQVPRDLVYGGAPNTRQHWQAKPLRKQARHLYENDPIARRVVDSMVCNMIGGGVVPIARSQNKVAEKTVERFMRRWMTSVDCDFTEDNSFSGLQSLIARAVIVDGAVFVRRVVKNKRLMLRVFEHDYLDVNRNGENLKNGNLIVNGIEYHHSTCKVVAYWFWQYHPEDSINSPGYAGYGVRFETPNPSSISTQGIAGESIRVPAAEVCHIKRVDRPDQQDGISWLAPALIKLWDLREYEEAKLKQQKLQASFTAFVQDNYALTEEERESIIGLEADAYESITGREVSPGHIEELPPGKSITFPSPTGTTDEKFVERCLRQIAGAMGVSYEIFNDYSQVSYSSGRMGFLEMDRHLKHVLKTIFEPQFFMRISDWVLFHLETNNAIPENHGVSIMWTPPAREFIDPAAESKAISDMVAANLISMREAHAMMGKDFEKTLEDIASSNKLMEDSGLGKLTMVPGGATNLPEGEGGEEAPV